MKFYLTMPNNAVEAMLKRHGHSVAKQWSDGFDVLLFPGGPDITPFLYGERLMPKTKIDFRRDMLENSAYRRVSITFPKVGICRGAQLLHVLAGGRLWQHVDNHDKGVHEIYDVVNKKKVRVTSTHHQMMRPISTGSIIAGTNVAKSCAGDIGQSRYSDRKPIEEDIEDLEVVYHPLTGSLCFQPHPEYNVEECQQYFFQLLDDYIKPTIGKSSAGV